MGYTATGEHFEPAPGGVDLTIFQGELAPNEDKLRAFALGLVAEICNMSPALVIVPPAGTFTIYPAESPERRPVAIIDIHIPMWQVGTKILHGRIGSALEEVKLDGPHGIIMIRANGACTRLHATPDFHPAQ